MSRQSFTKEQVQVLEENPYTEFVSPSSIRFTDEFKAELWQSCLAGKTAVEFFQEKGYDVNVIGQKRIANTLNKISRDHLARAAETEDDKIQRLEEEVRRLSYELNALKKIIALGNRRR